MADGLLILNADPSGRGTTVLGDNKPPQVLIHGFRGPQGATGASGAGGDASFNSIASGNIQSNMVVASDGAGKVYVPDLTNPGDVTRVVAIAATAANDGLAITCKTSGQLTEVAWNWQPGPIYCALSGGTLTQAPPATGAVLQVAVAISPTTIQVGIRPATLRGN